MNSMKMRSALRGLMVVGSLTALIAAAFVVPAGASDPDAVAKIKTAGDATVAVAKLEQVGNATAFKVRMEGLTPGFHGFHVHSVGTCAAPFTSAGGHYNTGSATHGHHAGDLPSMLINSDGTGSLRFVTDAFDVADVIGRALIVHADPDNFGNVPVGTGATQYAANSTGTTNDTATGLTANTGNAGARTACGTIEAA